MMPPPVLSPPTVHLNSSSSVTTPVNANRESVALNGEVQIWSSQEEKSPRKKKTFTTNVPYSVLQCLLSSVEQTGISASGVSFPHIIYRRDLRRFFCSSQPQASPFSGRKKKWNWKAGYLPPQLLLVDDCAHLCFSFSFFVSNSPSSHMVGLLLSEWNGWKSSNLAPRSTCTQTWRRANASGIHLR